MAKRSLKDLKKQLAKQENSGGNNTGGTYYPFWRLPFDGSTSIRVLEDPDEENPLIVYIDYKEHALHIGDEVVRVPCPKTVSHNAPCPICELSAKLYKANNEEKGKYFYRDAYVLLRGLITKDGMEYDDDDDDAVGQVKAFKLSYQLAQKFKSEMGKLDDDEIFWDLEEGLDFIIEKQKQVTGDREYGKYDLGSGFARKNSAIPEEWIENIPEESLSELVGEIPSYDELAELLQKHLRDASGSSSDDDEDDATETEEDLKEKLNRNKAKKDKKDKKKEKKKEEAVAEVEESVLDDLDDDDDDDDILSMLDDD